MYRSLYWGGNPKSKRLPTIQITSVSHRVACFEFSSYVWHLPRHLEKVRSLFQRLDHNQTGTLQKQERPGLGITMVLRNCRIEWLLLLQVAESTWISRLFRTFLIHWCKNWRASLGRRWWSCSRTCTSGRTGGHGSAMIRRESTDVYSSCSGKREHRWAKHIKDHQRPKQRWTEIQTFTGHLSLLWDFLGFLALSYRQITWPWLFT